MKIEDNEEISNYLNVIVKVQNESEKVETEIGQIVKTTFPDENPKSKEVRKAQIIKSEIEMGNHEEDIADKKYKCPVPDCNNSYTDGSNYRRHYRKNHKSIETSTTLEKDPEGEDDSKTETIKFENGNNSIQKPAIVQVKESNKHIDNFDNFAQHKEDNHPKIEPTAEDLTCTECDTILKTMKNLKRHIKEQHTEAKRPQAHKEEVAMCDICSALFKNRPSLRGHKRKVHGNIENIPCPHCDQVIQTKYKLSQHIYAVHNLQESPCEHCGKTYKNIKLLQAHKKVMHHGLK